MSVYYFKIDHYNDRITHAAIEHSNEKYKTVWGAIESERDLKEVLDPVCRVKSGPLPRKPRGVEFEKDARYDWVKWGFKE